jgi:hypothetical protein
MTPHFAYCDDCAVHLLDYIVTCNNLELTGHDFPGSDASVVYVYAKLKCICVRVVYVCFFTFVVV